ncbi:hypothetical protein GCM10010170_025380 [Dactylosporangium salmoneum]|uniref:Uncharacterized protein n=1 Tax=Dactylosporangium salmoneum TaxID=53361 RepID=A0ABN3G0Q0_9ACTN
MAVWNEDGTFAGYVETKWGPSAKSKYEAANSKQRANDDWLRANRGLNITVVMGGP